MARKGPGRPRKPYITSWKKSVDGLRRRRDGRWVIVETGETFVEPDEHRAVARFRRWELEQAEGQGVTEVAETPTVFGSVAALKAAQAAGMHIHGNIDGSYGVNLPVPEPLLWSWLKDQIENRPEKVAEMIGMPELARLADLPKREPSPTLKRIGKLYHDKAEVKHKQRRQAELFWSHFQKWMAKHEVKTLRHLTPALTTEYADEVKAEARQKRDRGEPGGSAKYVKQRFTTIRTVINFARKRGEHPDDIRRALDCCATMQPPKDDSEVLPEPISREDFHALLNTATDPRMKAILLVMLNLCMYPGEASHLDWGDINLKAGTVVTRRPKTGIIRAGVLWPETTAALQAIRPAKPRKDDPVFTTRESTRWDTRTINTQYRKLRQRAGVSDDVKCAHCRDGAYTAAIDSGATVDEVKFLAGHAIGISDHYLKRKPTMVAGAVEGIHRTYFDSLDA